MARHAHFLHKIRRAPLPRYLFFFDTETKPVKIADTHDGEKIEQVFTMGFGAYTRRRVGLDAWDETQWFQIDHPRDWWEWVTSKIAPKTKAYVFAHNVGFDFTVTKGFEYLPEFGFYLTNFIVDDPPTMLEFDYCPDNCGMRNGRVNRIVSKCEKSHKKLVIIDTLNYFRMSLENLGKSIGTTKLVMPKTPDGEPAPVTDENRAEWIEYNKQDVQVLIDAVREYLQFITIHQLGPFQITQASQSFAAFRYRFMQHQILIDDNEDALALSRSAYYGGRVDCFMIGQRVGVTSYKVDINSMYPFIMSEFEFPTQLATLWKRVDLDEYAKLRGRYKFVADCIIETSEPAYPMRRNGKLIFPIGRFRTTLTTPEIEHAYDQGHLRKINQLAMYHFDPIFKTFVEYFYSLRLDAKAHNDERSSFFLKIMMNSLYGKFGQNGRKWKTDETLSDHNDIRVWSEIDADSDEILHFRQIGRIVQMLEGHAESANSHPAIAAHITAHSRMYLWQLIKQAGRNNVFYCDTDSLFINENGLHRLHGVLNETQLGALKLEDTADTLIINGLKDYQFGGHIALKGVRDAHNPVAPNVYKHENWRGLRGALHDGDLSRMVITRGLKRLRRIYDKGVVEPDGTVSPFILDDVAP